MPDKAPQLMLKAEYVALRRLLLPLLKFSVGSDSKDSACNAGDLDSIPGGEDPLEKDRVIYACERTRPCLLQNSIKVSKY